MVIKLMMYYYYVANADIFGRPLYMNEREISHAAIQEIIERAMAEKGVTKQEIPIESPFTTPESARHSKRYFETKGFAWFSCPGNCHRWSSAHSWCFIDLKKQTICYRDAQNCRKCESVAEPEFTEESVERMTEYAVMRYLIKIGTLYAVSNPNMGKNVTKGRLHDATLCEMCKRLGRSCWN